MGIVCFFNAQHHKYQVQELLGLLSKYLEVESKTLRTGLVLQEELRALKFLYKSAKVHIKLEQNVGKEGEGEGRVKIGSKRSEEEKGGEKKRAKYIRPYMTTVPLDMSIDPIATAGKDNTAPIPLPLAHRQLQTPGNSRTFGDLNLGINGSGGFGITHTQSPFPNVPTGLQHAVNGFSIGDQDFTNYLGYSPPNLFPQAQAQGGLGPESDQSQFTFTNFAAGVNGINPTPSPNTEADMWAALGAFNSSGTAFTQVLSNMDVAGAQLGEISPPSSTGDLPGSTNYHLTRGYEGYGYGTSGLGIQLGHTPTPMHGGYYNPAMAHPQPHVYTQQQPHVNQYLQPNPQQTQAIRRQSYPLAQTHTQVQGQGMRWSHGMIPQNGERGAGSMPQIQDAAKVARSNSLWVMPSKQP